MDIKKLLKDEIKGSLTEFKKYLGKDWDIDKKQSAENCYQELLNYNLQHNEDDAFSAGRINALKWVLEIINSK